MIAGKIRVGILVFHHSTSQIGDFTITNDHKGNSQENPDEIKERLRTPKHWKKEMYAVVESIFAGSRMKVACADGVSRLARIPGGKRRSIKRIRVGDLLIVIPWDIQDEKADIVYHYKIYQARSLSRMNKLPEEINIF